MTVVVLKGARNEAKRKVTKYKNKHWTFTRRPGFVSVFFYFTKQMELRHDAGITVSEVT